VIPRFLGDRLLRERDAVDPDGRAWNHDLLLYTCTPDDRVSAWPANEKAVMSQIGAILLPTT